MADEDSDAGTFDYYSERYTWSQHQAEALHQRKLDIIDWGNVATEIEEG